MRSRDEQAQRDPECVICARGVPLDLLVELPSTWVTATREAPLPGYVCVVSKIHVIELYELRDQARHLFWDDVSTVAEAVQRATGSPKINYEIHGNTIPHLHLHLYPRFADDPYVGGPIDTRLASFSRSPEQLSAIGRAFKRITTDASASRG